MSDQAVLAQSDELQKEFESGGGGTDEVDDGTPRRIVRFNDGEVVEQRQDLPPPYCDGEGSKQQQQQQHVPGWPQSTARGVYPDYLVRSGQANALHQQALNQQLQQQAARQNVRVITLPSGCQVVRVHTSSAANIRLKVVLTIFAIKMFIVIAIVIYLIA